MIPASLRAATQDLLSSLNSFIRDARLDQAVATRLRAFFRYQLGASAHLNALEANHSLLQKMTPRLRAAIALQVPCHHAVHSVCRAAPPPAPHAPDSGAAALGLVAAPSHERVPCARCWISSSVTEEGSGGCCPATIGRLSGACCRHSLACHCATAPLRPAPLPLRPAPLPLRRCRCCGGVRTSGRACRPPPTLASSPPPQLSCKWLGALSYFTGMKEDTLVNISFLFNNQVYAHNEASGLAAPPPCRRAPPPSTADARTCRAAG